MENKDININKPFEDSVLNFKDHQIFFNDYYDFKRNYNKCILGAYFDYTLLNEAFIYLFMFINNSIAQIELKKKIEDITKAKKRIASLISDKQNSKAIELMENLYEEICSICMSLELEPKPESQEDSDEVKFWKEESHRGLREIKKGFMDVLSIKNG